MSKYQVPGFRSQVSGLKRFRAFGVGLMVCCFFLYIFSRCYIGRNCGSINAEEFSPLEKAAKENSLVEFIYDSHGKKDPFATPIISVVGRADIELLTGVKLEGIIWDKKNPMAIVNNKIVGIGDEIAGAKIVEITKNEVLFIVNGQQVKLKLRIIEEGVPLHLE